MHFEYDKLEKMGELATKSVTHDGISFPNHYYIKGGKQWLAYTGRVGAIGVMH